MSTHPVPLLYRILFTIIDPAFCTLGMITHLLPSLRQQTLEGYAATHPAGPAATTSSTTATIHVLDSMAGFFATLGALEAVLLRVRARDVTVWRVVQGCVALLDCFMVYAALKMLVVEGRLEDVGAWRGDDWRLVIGNAVFGLLRTACAVGIGMGTGTGNERLEMGGKKRA